jgi:hypothetical protein
VVHVCAGVEFGEPLREEFVLDDRQINAMWKRQFGGDTAMSMAVSYFFASLALRHNHNRTPIAPSHFHTPSSLP